MDVCRQYKCVRVPVSVIMDGCLQAVQVCACACKCHYGWLSAGSTSVCVPVSVIMDGCLQAVQVYVCL
jgi:hypothetical protein